MASDLNHTCRGADMKDNRICHVAYGHVYPSAIELQYVLSLELAEGPVTIVPIEPLRTDARDPNDDARAFESFWMGKDFLEVSNELGRGWLGGTATGENP